MLMQNTHLWCSSMASIASWNSWPGHNCHLTWTWEHIWDEQDRKFKANQPTSALVYKAPEVLEWIYWAVFNVITAKRGSWDEWKIWPIFLLNVNLLFVSKAYRGSTLLTKVGFLIKINKINNTKCRKLCNRCSFKSCQKYCEYEMERQ